MRCQNFNLDETRAKLNIWELVLFPRLARPSVPNKILVLQYTGRRAGNELSALVEESWPAQGTSSQGIASFLDNTIAKWKGEGSYEILSWLRIEKKKMWHFPSLLCLPDLFTSSLKKWSHTWLLVWNNDNKKYHHSQEFRLTTVSLLNSKLIIIISSWLLIYSLGFPAFSLNK